MPVLRTYLNNEGRLRFARLLAEAIHLAGGTARVLKTPRREWGVGKFRYDVRGRFAELEVYIRGVGDDLPVRVQWFSHDQPFDPHHFDDLTEDRLSATSLFANYSGARARLPGMFTHASQGSFFYPPSTHLVPSDGIASARCIPPESH